MLPAACPASIRALPPPSRSVLVTAPAITATTTADPDAALGALVDVQGVPPVPPAPQTCTGRLSAAPAVPLPPRALLAATAASPRAISLGTTSKPLASRPVHSAQAVASTPGGWARPDAGANCSPWNVTSMPSIWPNAL